MLGERTWFVSTQDSMGASLNRFGTLGTTGEFFERLLIQGKKISQLVAWMWSNEDPKAAQELDKYFKSGKNEMLKRLLFANESEGGPEYNLLLKVFQAEYLPIFEKEDEDFFIFRVAIDKFEGNISDPGPSDIGSGGNRILVFTIPYPVRPPIFDDTNSDSPDSPTGFTVIKKSELKEWLEQRPDEKPYFYENNPYIPTSSS